MKHKLKELEEKICKSTNIDGDFNTTLPVTDRISRQKITKDQDGLGNNIAWFSPIRVDQPFKYVKHSTNHNLSYKTNLNQPKIADTTKCLLQPQQKIKLDINNRKISIKPPHIWRLISILLNILWINEQTERQFKTYFELKENKNRIYQNVW